MITTLLLMIIYMAFISLGLPDSILGSAWPAIYREIGVPDSYAGIIYMIVSGGTILSSFFSHKINSRFGTGLVTLVSVLLTAAALMGISFGNHFFFFCVMAIPLGLGAGSVDAALNHYVALHFAARHMNWLHCFWGVGATGGPVILSFFLNGGSSWKMGYRTIGTIQFLLAAILLAALPLWKKAEREKEEEKEEKATVTIREAIKLPGAKTILVSFFCYCAIEATMGLWGSSYLVFSKGIAAETAAKGTAVFYFGITFGRFLAGFISMKVGNRNLIRSGEALIAAGMICLLLPMGTFLSQAGFLLIGIGCAPIYPSIIHETPASFGKKYSQALIGIQMACAYLGTILLAPLFGVLASRISFALFPFYLLLLLIFMVVMIEVTVKKVRKESCAEAH